jgi:hypothetical protein
MSRQPNGGFIGTENITDNTNASGIYTLSDVAQKVADNEFPTARYTPSRSLRFRSGASAYLNRTPASAGNRRTWTFSCWIKRGSLSIASTYYPRILSTDNTARLEYNFMDDNTLRLEMTGAGQVITNQVFRDTSAWYHIVVAVDTTQAINSDRAKIFVNGNQITSFSSYPTITQNYETGVNAAQAHSIGRYHTGGSDYFDGYITEINHIDGQALTPSAFGEYETRTGEWKPKRYAGTYGTNGFYLSFANNSTTSTLGLDDGTGLPGSGDGSNDWTSVNHSLSIGSTYDSMVDVPGVGAQVINDTGGVVRGNYPIMSPADNFASATVSNAGLTVTTTNPGNDRHIGCSMAFPSTGKWYWENTVSISDALDARNGMVLMETESFDLLGADTKPNVQFACQNTSVSTNNGAINNANVNEAIRTGGGGTVCFAYDADEGKLWIRKNSAITTSLTPNVLSLYNPRGALRFRIAEYSGSVTATNNLNFGQRPFAYTPPAGFKSLCTTNLQEPTIKKPQEQFDIKLWTGNGSSQTIGNTARQRDNYEISRSLRFNSADSSQLTRTPASAGNRKTWTWSGWVKRGAIGGNKLFFTSRFNTAPWLVFGFISDNLYLSTTAGQSGAGELITTAVYRDTSAWYHIVLSVDTTQAIASNRIKFYVDGVQVTAFSTTNYPSQNTDLQVNDTVLHQLGGYTSLFFDGYLTEVNLIDGQALTPESFGVFDVDGSWQAKPYTGTYGTNGFHLNFSDNSDTTATTLGKDRAGSNNWTPNNFSVTAGIDNDSVVDVPTDWGGDSVDSGGEVRGNYATWDANYRDGAGTWTTTNGSLKTIANVSSAAYGEMFSTLSSSSGKWYCEIRIDSVNTAGIHTAAAVGISSDPGYYISNSNKSISENTSPSYQINLSSGTISPGNSSYGSAFVVGDTVMVALDLDNNRVYFGKNGTWFSSGNPATGTNPAFNIASGTYSIGVQDYHGPGYPIAYVANFGQLPFTYTPPAGFKSLNTKNLNEQSPFVTGPDLVWIKSRSAAFNHILADTVNGPIGYLSSSTTDAFQVTSIAVNQFTSNGFTVGSISGGNQTGSSHVGWCWNAGSRTVGNQDGNITSTVRANPEAGFSIVSYTGNGTAGTTIGHGLNNQPKLIITKRLNSTSNWWVYSEGQEILYSGQWQYLNLNFSTQNTADASNAPYFKRTPTTSVYTVGGDGINAAGGTYVSYCWAEIPGYSKFAAYKGNASSNGPFIYTGFKPRWIMIKRLDISDSWFIVDAARDPFNNTTKRLQPNASSTESVDSTGYGIDFTSNGFKVRTENGQINGSAGNYIYAAFAEQPFKHALAR